MNYSKALKFARAIAGLQQKELADLAGIDASYISLIEQGKRTPSVRAIHKLSHALKIPAHLLTFLAMESEDAALAHPDELKSLGESLTRLVMEHGKQFAAQPPPTRRRKKQKPVSS
ncbi:MAG TPA: helix-turn-helix transcriptional regulator [Pyrinomonadaceae bacterium]|nr:helix-turn-helix transcriptional regulator [Pyrinomonadaceae bacterium]